MTEDWMPKWMTALETFFGKAGGYTSGALFLATGALLLRAADKMDNPTTLGIVVGVFGANAVGAAAAAYRK